MAAQPTTDTLHPEVEPVLGTAEPDLSECMVTFCGTNWYLLASANGRTGRISKIPHDYEGYREAFKKSPDCINCREAFEKLHLSDVTIDIKSFTPVDDSDVYIAFDLACNNGCLEEAKTLATKYKLTPEGVRSNYNYALRSACENGHLEVAKWLADHFCLTPVDARAIDNYALRSACVSGHLEVAEWLVNRFCLISEDARSGGNYVMHSTCLRGHLEVAKWLTKQFGFTREDIQSGSDSALLYACMNGHLEVAKWLINQFGLTREDVQFKGHSALGFACCNEHLEVAKWLTDRFKLTQEDILTETNVHWKLDGSHEFLPENPGAGECNLLWVACMCGHLEVAKWLTDRFKLTRKHIQSEYDSVLQSALKHERFEMVDWLKSQFRV